jgi:hypothetical protein
MFVRFIRTWSHALHMKNRKYFCLAHPLRKYGSSAAQDRTSPFPPESPQAAGNLAARTDA